MRVSFIRLTKNHTCLRVRTLFAVATLFCVLVGKAVAWESSENASLTGLGRALFTSPLLSRDGRVACSSCHDPARAYADSHPNGIGVGGKIGTRNVPSLIGVANDTSFFWDGRRARLEEVVLDPITNPFEMGSPYLADAIERLRSDPELSRKFQDAFPKEARNITSEQVQRALIAFVTSLSTGKSTFDRAQQRHEALPGNAELGRKLFEGVAGCASCHALTGTPMRFSDGKFHHSGIGEIVRSEHLSRLAQDVVRQDLDANALGPKVLADSHWASLGRFVVSHRPTDIGAFRTPSLRNVAVTSPYMHDGSIATLSDAVDHEIYYRSLSTGHPINLTQGERQAIVAFLETLTDMP